MPADLEPLAWTSDAVNGSLAEFDWPALQQELSQLRVGWIDLIIAHAKEHGEYFPEPEIDEDDSEA